MIFPTLSLEAARAGLAARDNDEPWSGTAFVHWTGEGEKFDPARADGLLQKLNAVKDQLSPDEPLPSNRGKDFEGPASALVHAELGLSPRVAGSRDFWLWLTFVAAEGEFARLVDWRFGSKDIIDPVNYGVGRRSAIWEGLFARLWLCGNIGFDAGAQDPYRIAKKGDIDIWRSHIIRQEYGRARQVAQALIDYQYPDQEAERPLKVKELRELAKRLRIADASTSYELLDSGSIKDVIVQNVERIRESGKQEEQLAGT